MASPAPDCLALASKLSDLASKISPGDDEVWKEITLTSQTLANGLRTRSPEDYHTALGRKKLPQTLSTILRQAGNGSSTPGPTQVPAIFESLRVGANLCMEHDENRGYLLDSGYIDAVVAILNSYAELLPPIRRDTIFPLSVPHLNIIKTSIGVLLNACMGYDPVKSQLITLEAPTTILRLSTAIYPPGAWIRTKPQDIIPDAALEVADATLTEVWTIRSTLSDWAWRAITEIKDDALDLFGPDELPLLVVPLFGFTRPYPTPTSFFSSDSPLRRALLNCDLEILKETCSLLESLTIDVEDIRLSLARGMTFPDEHGGVGCLAEILRFIDQGDHHPLWASESQAEQTKKQKAFDLYKAAMVKSVVELAGEEKNTDVLWDESDPEKPGGVFISQMVNWIKSQKNLKEQDRDDLVICATLSLGNLVRFERHSAFLVDAPVSLSPFLAALLEPDADMKVKHGVISLLKHLAYAPASRAPLGEAGIVSRIVESNIFKDTSDIVETIQMSAIGTVKHLCTNNADNCFALVLPSSGGSSEDTGLNQILALLRRSDTIAVKSEGTRVFVNVIRTLWSQITPASEKRTASMNAITTPSVALALAQLIGRSKKYPILINEGMVALTLLSLHGRGADYVLDAITTPLPKEIQPVNPLQPEEPSEITSPVSSPGRALDMLVSMLRSSDARIREEVRVNVCTLLGQVGREGNVSAERATELEKMKAEVRPVLEKVSTAGEEETKLKGAAKKALQLWKGNKE